MSVDARHRRARVLDALRGALDAEATFKQRTECVAERLAQRARHLVPERTRGKSRDELSALFRGFLEGQSATVVEVASAEGVPSAIANYLRGANLPSRVRMGTDAWLAALPWKREPALSRETGPNRAVDEVGVAHAAAAIAETGTLLLASGADNPVTLNFLPETHIVVVEEKDLVGSYEDAWDALRSRLGDGVMPRTVNFVSGPSRSADIGGRLVVGAHGPRRLCVVLVKG